MSRFKVGDTVWYGRGEHERQLVVARVIDNGFLPVYQYSFEAPNNGWACGEQSLRAERDGRDLTLRECFKDEDGRKHDKHTPTRINTIASALRQPIDEFADYGVERIFSDSLLLFKPDLKMVQWIRDYANGRLIIDVGSGQGHLVNMLKRGKDAVKAIGIEPNFNSEAWLKFRMHRNNLEDIDINEIIARPIEDCKGLIDGIGKDRGMLIFARPKAKDFVHKGIANMPYGMEALFITTKEDFESFNYLGRFKERAKLLTHTGVSEDNEVVYSIIR